jgi:hypothetical protein
MDQCTAFSDVRKVERNPSPTEQQIRTALFQDVLEATTRNYKATREFEEVMGQFPSGLPHPDGVQRIKNASNKLTIARKEMATAHNRLNDYLSRGIVPDDLKRMLIDHSVIAIRTTV